jgi:hypothetical protein
LVLAVAAVMVAMLLAGQTPAMAQVVFFDNHSCDNDLFFGANHCDGVSEGEAVENISGITSVSLTVT